MKTIFTILLSIISVITVVATLGKEAGYPFEPGQFVLLEMFIIGLSSILLALEPNHNKISGNYLETVIVRSFPNALAMLLPVVATMIVANFVTMESDARNAIALSALMAAAFTNLVALCKPFTRWRIGVIIAMAVLIGGAIPATVFLFGDMLILKPVAENPYIFIIMVSSAVGVAILLQLFRGKIERVIAKHVQRAIVFEEKRQAEK